MADIIFFIQAEDGIRDLTVTGVQTCALPIWTGRPVFRAAHEAPRSRARDHDPGAGRPERYLRLGNRLFGRSEERRVGKECRYRQYSYPYKRKVTIAM